MKTFCIAAMVLFAACTKPGPEKSANVTAGGGTYTIGGVTIDVPEGALDSPVGIKAEIIDDFSRIKQLPYDALAMVEFGPEGTRFSKNIKVTIPIGKLPNGEKLVAYYYNEDEKVWTVVGEAMPGAGSASFEINHFSLYAVGGHYDYVDGNGISLSEKAKGGYSDADIFESFKNRIENNLTDLFSWDIIGGRYYRVERYSEDYYYDTGDKEGQGIYQIGTGVPGWTGYHDSAASLFRFMTDSQSYEKLDYNAFNELKGSGNEVYSTSFERELHLVPSEMTATLEGTLAKKGDKAKVRFRLSAKTGGGKSEYMVSHSCVGFTSGYSDTTPNGEYDRKIEIPDDDPSLGGNPPMAYQSLKIETTNGNKSLSLSSSTLTTDLNGEAVVTVTALSDNPDGEIKAVYDYQSDRESDHSEASVKIENGSSWSVTGILSDIRGESEFGITASTDISFEFTFDPSKVENISIYGEKMEIIPAEFSFTASNVSISNGRYILPGMGGMDFIMSNITPKTLTGVKGFITSQDGVMCAVASDPARPTVRPVFITYDMQTITFDGSGNTIDEESETVEWSAPLQFSFPLKEGNYSPLVMTASNIATAQTDKDNFYVMLMTGGLIAGAEESTLTGDVVISRGR